MTGITNELSQQRAAKVAGLAYLLIILSSLLSMVFIDPKITVKGDSLATINNIIEKELLFRIDTTITLLMFATVIVLSLTLYNILRPINSYLAKLALLFRVGEAIVGIVAVLGGLTALLLLTGDVSTLSFDTGQLYTLADLLLASYWEATLAIFVLMALGSIIIFYLFLKSRYIPKALAIWGIASYSLVLTGALISLIFSGNAFMILGAQTILFEVVIGCWLLFKGIKA